MKMIKYSGTFSEHGNTRDVDTNARAYPRTGEAKASEAVRNKAPSGAGPGHGPLAGGIPVL